MLWFFSDPDHRRARRASSQLGPIPVNISRANPAVVTWPGYGLQADDPVCLICRKGSPLPSIRAVYYVLLAGLAPNSFEFSTAAGGAGR